MTWIRGDVIGMNNLLAQLLMFLGLGREQLYYSHVIDYENRLPKGHPYAPSNNDPYMPRLHDPHSEFIRNLGDLENYYYGLERNLNKSTIKYH